MVPVAEWAFKKVLCLAPPLCYAAHHSDTGRSSHRRSCMTVSRLLGLWVRINETRAVMGNAGCLVPMPWRFPSREAMRRGSPTAHWNAKSRTSVFRSCRFAVDLMGAPRPRARWLPSVQSLRPEHLFCREKSLNRLQRIREMTRKWAEFKTDIVLTSFLASAFSSFWGRRCMIIQLTLEQRRFELCQLVHAHIFCQQICNQPSVSLGFTPADSTNCRLQTAFSIQVGNPQV